MSIDEPAPLELSLFERSFHATERSIVVTDPHRPDNPLIYVNPAFERLTGYSAAEVLGQNCRFLSGSDTDPAVLAKVRRAIEARESVTVLLLNHRADGTAFWNEVSITPVLDSDGEVTHFVGVQSDVTARVVSEVEREAALLAETETRTTLESLLAAAPVGLAFVDRELRFTRVNAAMAALTGI
ncbi:MAG: PAS domain-containing protein, partial [Actinomycetota bacterium]|nr:PAS domain-containing protein [Actinomycetota bacterium]